MAVYAAQRAALDLGQAMAVAVAPPPCQGPQGDLWTSDELSDREQAAQGCQECPLGVLAACRALASETAPTWGVWGGRDYSVEATPEDLERERQSDWQVRWYRARPVEVRQAAERKQYAKKRALDEASRDLTVEDSRVLRLRSVLAEVADVEEMESQARREYRERLYALRCAGWSWGEVGRLLGMTYQSARAIVHGQTPVPEGEPVYPADPDAAKSARVLTGSLRQRWTALQAERKALAVDLTVDLPVGVAAGLARYNTSDLYKWSHSKRHAPVVSGPVQPGLFPVLDGAA